MTFRLTLEAEADIEAITLYIAEDSPSAARRWFDDVHLRCKRLGEMPGMGVARPEVRPDLRMFPAGKLSHPLPRNRQRCRNRARRSRRTPMAKTALTKIPIRNHPLHWFLRGARAGLSTPGLILASAFIGFGSLAREDGFSLAESAFMTVMIWALPAIIVLMAIKSGATIFAAAFVVTLSSVRLMQMVIALVPEMRTPRTRPWVLYLLSHFVAVTSWVMAFLHFPSVPKEQRTRFLWRPCRVAALH